MNVRFIFAKYENDISGLQDSSMYRLFTLMSYCKPSLETTLFYESRAKLIALF